MWGMGVTLILWLLVINPSRMFFITEGEIRLSEINWPCIGLVLDKDSIEGCRDLTLETCRPYKRARRIGVLFSPVHLTTQAAESSILSISSRLSSALSLQMLPFLSLHFFLPCKLSPWVWPQSSPSSPLFILPDMVEGREGQESMHRLA